MPSKKPSFITLTGADDATDFNELCRLSEQYPSVEWGILSSSQRAGSGRYPSAEWIEKFSWACPNVNRSLHLCGRDVDAFIAGDAVIMKRLSRFDRVQLNFNQRRMPKDLEAIARRGEDLAQRIILQYNSANAAACATVQQYLPSVHILFDSSGGRGVSPDKWPAPVASAFCGYSGGLGPDNIASELLKIQEVAGSTCFWIDMEGKLRFANDLFSIASCEAVLSTIS